MAVYTQQVETEKRMNEERLTVIKSLEDQQSAYETRIKDLNYHVNTLFSSAE